MKEVCFRIFLFHFLFCQRGALQTDVLADSSCIFSAAQEIDWTKLLLLFAEKNTVFCSYCLTFTHHPPPLPPPFPPLSLPCCLVHAELEAPPCLPHTDMRWRGVVAGSTTAPHHRLLCGSDGVIPSLATLLVLVVPRSTRKKIIHRQFAASHPPTNANARSFARILRRTGYFGRV